MLYEFNGKIYIKPFSNRLVEVEIQKDEEEYIVKATNRIINITPKIKSKITEISLKDAYKKTNKGSKKVLNTI